jgi:mono/diheme cytochrome c family protein
MNFAGDSCNARSVLIDSALGLLGAAPPSNHIFLNEIDWLETYLGNHPPPKYPYPTDPAKVAAGKPLFDQYCAHCHDRKDTTGTVMSLDYTDPETGKKLGTDPARVESWNADAAIRANNFVKAFGIERPGLVQANPTGYVRAFLDGIWLRAPYLHNGSVPTLRDLLNPAAARPKVFYRGYDVYDPEDVGFISRKVQAERLKFPWDEVPRVATRYEVCMATKDDACLLVNGKEIPVRSNSNAGHEFGTDLSPDQKNALLEYLKTL